jgi:prepilin-type N-terminal cleavage/methylation domain-containing protein
MRAMRPRLSIRTAGAAGYSLVELLVVVAVITVIMGATMAGMRDAVRANETVLAITGTNNTLRAGMDLMVRDLLQVASGLPPGHVIFTPSGDDSALIRLPGPPGTAFTNANGDTDIAAVVPGTGRGPEINGVKTDTITVLMADNNFTNVGLTAVTSTSVIVDPAHNIGTGPDRVTPGQLMMVTKGSFTTLVQVTQVDAAARRLTFAAGDSLKLNQPDAAEGTLKALNAEAPVNSPASTTVTRIRMISYYLDDTVPGRPRLVRRINNGDPIKFDNKLGTVVAFDIENLQFSYDLVDGNTNPANVRFSTEDLAGTGACKPEPCTFTQIRKVNVALTARSKNGGAPNAKVHRNTLTSQVSLRAMAFVNRYNP